MIDSPTGAVAQRDFEALGSSDGPTEIALFAADIDWHQPGRNRFSGTHTGVDAIGRLLGGMAEVSEGTFELDVAGPMMVNGELVAVPVRFHGTRSGARMDMTGTIDLLTVRDGTIAEVRPFSGDAHAEDAFWGDGA